MSPRVPWAALAVGVLFAAPATDGRAQARGAGTGGTVALRQAERMVGRTKRVLMIAAHPDDEDTELLTVLVRGEGAEAAYLSLSRGEGGQNLIGRELGEELGLLRAQELLAARRLDGARQYFTRAFDFGFSKTLDETARFWPLDSLLKDAVRVVRRFRPQILVSIFSGTARDGHGQHQAAGWTAMEVFAAAGDSTRFPELLREEGLRPWAPLKLYRSVRFDTTGGYSAVLEGGVLDPDIGQSYRQVAMRARSLHRSQDMGVLQDVGESTIRLLLIEDRSRGGSPGSLWSGIDTTESAPRSAIEVEDARRHRAEAAANRARLVFDASTARGRLIPGETVEVRLSAWNAGSRPAQVEMELLVPDGWAAVPGRCADREAPVAPGRIAGCGFTVTVPRDAEPTTPYFLRQPRAGALYRWDVKPELRGEPFESPLATARFRFVAGNDSSRTIDREVVHRYRDQALGEMRRPLVVVPRIALEIEPGTAIWPVSSRATRAFAVTLHHTGRDTSDGTVSLELPPGWPPVASRPFRLHRDGERETVSFDVRPPPAMAPGPVEIRAVARTRAGQRYDATVVDVDYPHIEPRLMIRPAAARVSAVDARLPSVRRIGYVRGAADRIPEALLAMGLPVELLDPASLDRTSLGQFDVIVIGSRAYEVEPAVAENNSRLLEYVAQGGRLVVQYQQLEPYFREMLPPRPLSLSASLEPGRPPRLRDSPPRVSDETAPVRVVDPASPLMNVPNRIEPADWSGWVQERGLYFAGTWDPAWHPLLEMADPGEPPRKGGLLVLSHGRGAYIYTGLSFFRQLPAGVSGAVRLFLNLLTPSAATSSR